MYRYTVYVIGLVPLRTHQNSHIETLRPPALPCADWSRASEPAADILQQSVSHCSTGPHRNDLLLKADQIAIV